MDRKSVVFVFSLGDEFEQTGFTEIWSSLVTKASAKYDLKWAKTKDEALALFREHPEPKAILVTDPGIIAAENVAVSRKVVDYAHESRTAVILTGVFSTSIRPGDLDTYFDTMWRLPWRVGNYTREVVRLNGTAAGVPGHGEGLMSAYSQKALWLRSVANGASWYMDPESSGPSQTPVAFTGIGKGWLGYTGDVNGEDGTTAVVMAMIGAA